MKLRRLLICAATGAIGVAPFAHPLTAVADDDTDDLFVATLQLGQVPIVERQQAIDLAHEVCAGLDAGASHLAAILNLVGDGTSYGVADAAFFVGASTAAYCPEHNLGEEI